jgi:uncharacterized protein (TIGR00251 family)
MKTIQIKVKPSARVSQLIETDEGPWKAQIKAPPVDGKATLELIKLVSKHFGINKSAVEIRSGQGSRLKLVRIDDA